MFTVMEKKRPFSPRCLCPPRDSTWFHNRLASTFSIHSCTNKPWVSTENTVILWEKTCARVCLPQGPSAQVISSVVLLSIESLTCMFPQNEGWLGGTIFQSSSNEKLSRGRGRLRSESVQRAKLWQVPWMCCSVVEIIEFVLSCLTVSQWPIFFLKKGCLRWNQWSCAKAEAERRAFAVQLCSFVSGLIVAREELLLLQTRSLFLIVPVSVFAPLPVSYTHARRPVVCNLVMGSECMWRWSRCFFVSGTTRTRPRACKRKQVTWRIVAP